MKWKKLLKGVGLGGLAAAKYTPFAGIASALESTFKEQGLLKDPAAEARMRELLLAFEKEILATDAARIADVNKTMQTELQFGNWFQRGWRPMLGYTLAAYVISNFIINPWFPEVPSIILPTEVVMILGAAIGITAWQRGQEKLAKLKNGTR
jgi:hypothetical protein